MDISLNWLGDHVDLSGLEPERIAHELTMRTALIEGLKDQAAALQGVVVGEVLSCERHPDADKLSVCSVAWGPDEPAHVVCGAPNVAAGQKIVYAPVKTRLPNGLKLKKAKIRGQVSEGMICAEDEIGLGPEHDGIIELDRDLEVGMPFGAVPGYCDVVLDIDNKSVTHRPDLWGHRGFARELAAIFDRELLPLPTIDDLPGLADGPGLTLDDQASCPLYAALCVRGRPLTSPDWLRFRLVACGMRPLNLLVDLSNYVMLELGQPTHPFDRDTVRGDRIVVRRAAEGERLVTLDDVERRLSAEDLVIADGEGAVALAGIMGSADAEVGDGTTRVLLESASFDAQRVRRSSSRLGLRTEALARFEKALDPALVEEAMGRYARLLTELDDQAVIEGVSRAGEAAAPIRSLVLDRDMVRSRLGLELDDDEIAARLASIGFGVEEQGGQLEVGVPSWRATRDIDRPEDLVEEVGRLAGYDRIPTEAPRGPLLLGARDGSLVVEEALRDVLSAGAGYTEVFSYSTLADPVFERVGLALPEGAPRLSNALQKDASRLRPAVAPSLLQHLEAGLRHDERLAAFEVGRGFAHPEGDTTTVQEQREVVALLGTRERVDGRELVRDLRGLVQAVAVRLELGRLVLEPWEPGDDRPWFHPRRSARVLAPDGTVLGRLGALSPEVLTRLEVQGSAAVLELDVDALGAAPRQGSAYRPLPRFPEARFDLAFVIGYDLGTEVLAEAMRQAAPKTLRSLEAFDVFRIGDDERSIAFHVVLQAADRTLGEKDLATARKKLVRAAEGLGARLR